MITKARDRFSETVIDDEIVVMSLESGDFFSMTGTGRAIWLAIDGDKDQTGLIADLAQSHDCPADAIAADVDGFLASLERAGLIVRR
jgi:hypothetical protein